MKLLLLFIILNIINVVMQTAKSIITIKASKEIAAVVNAVAYAIYTVVLVYTMCDLPLVAKAIVVGLCNLVGVYIVKLLEEKSRKDKLWKVESTIPYVWSEQVSAILRNNKIPFSCIKIEKYCIFNIYCATQQQSAVVKEKVLDQFGAKYFVSESKIL